MIEQERMYNHELFYEVLSKLILHMKEDDFESFDSEIFFDLLFFEEHLDYNIIPYIMKTF